MDGNEEGALVIAEQKYQQCMRDGKNASFNDVSRNTCL